MKESVPPRQAGDASQAAVSGPFGLWAASGLVAGAVGGLVDALTAIIRGVGGLGPEKAVRVRW